MRGLRLPSQTVPIALLVLAVSTFGLLIPKLGFYWDDWAKILVSQRFGLNGYWSYYAEDRPLSAWTHILLTPILGSAPLGWHIFTLLVRWLTAWGFYWLFVGIWPARRLQAAMTACLFLIYPVFTQQAIAVTFHQQWLQYALLTLSLIWMVSSIRRPERFWLFTALSILTALVQLSVTEYFIGLELLRPVILWILYAEEPVFKNRLRCTLRAWWPYLVLLVAYVLYRLFFIRLSGSDPYSAQTLFNFFKDPAGTLLWLVKTIFTDLQYTLVSVWGNVVSFGDSQVVQPFTWYSLAVGVVCTILLAWFFLHLHASYPDTSPSEHRFFVQLVVLAVVSLLAGPISAWATGRQIVSDFHSNRYALPAMLGASLAGIAVFEAIVPRRVSGIVLFCMLLGMTVGYHLRVENDYRWAWEKQTTYYWQLSWRAPALQPGTAVLSQDEPFENQGLFSTSAALNLLYPASTIDGHLPYWMYTIYPRFAQEIPNLREITYSSQFRTLKYKGTAADTLLVHYDPAAGGCLWVLDSLDRDNPYLKDSTRWMVALSNLNRVLPDTPENAAPRTDMFGPEPQHNWCYLFEKADLAVQQQDWQSAVDLYDEALTRGYNLEKSESNSPREWMPFVTALAHAGRLDESVKLVMDSYQHDERYQTMLCALWQQINASTPSSNESEAANSMVTGALKCRSWSMIVNDSR